MHEIGSYVLIWVTVLFMPGWPPGPKLVLKLCEPHKVGAYANQHCESTESINKKYAPLQM